MMARLKKKKDDEKEGGARILGKGVPEELREMVEHFFGDEIKVSPATCREMATQSTQLEEYWDQMLARYPTPTAASKVIKSFVTNARKGVEKKGEKYSEEMINIVKEKIGGEDNIGARGMRELAAQDGNFKKVWMKAVENNKGSEGRAAYVLKRMAGNK